MPSELVVGISGASGAIYGIRLLQVLAEGRGIRTHLVVSIPARRIIEEETDFSVGEVERLATCVYDPFDIGATIASGSFKTIGMVVAPCSMKTLSSIANSYNDNLLTRAADVTLKEGRLLVILPRETPLHIGHLQLMLRLAEVGATVLPPVPAFYDRPQTLADIVNHTVGRVLDQFGIEHQLLKRWEGHSRES